MRFRIGMIGAMCALVWAAPRVAAQTAGNEATPAPQAGQAGAGAAGQAARRRGAQALTGRVTAKTENGFSLQPARPNAAPVKVTTDAATTFVRFERATLQDLAEGYLVAVVGDRQDGTLSARGILRLKKLDGEPNRDELRAVSSLARAAARLLGSGTRGQAGPGAGGQQPAPPQTAQGAAGARRQGTPILGRVTAVQPLTIETIPLGRRGQPEKLTVQTTEATRIRSQAAATWGEIGEGASVLVVPKRPAPGQAATPAEGPVVASSIVLLRARETEGRRQQR